MLEADRHDRPERWIFAAERLYGPVSVVGKTVLEVGSGRGALAMYTALAGARRVYSIEPEFAGSRSGMVECQRERIAELGLDNVELITADFNRFEPGELRVDVLVSNASINHVFESRHHARSDRATWEGYIQVAQKFRRCLQPDGVAVVADAGRYGFFALARYCGLPERWCWRKQNIGFRNHQNAGTWREIFQAAGYRRCQIDYPLPYPLRSLGPLVNNRLTNFFLEGSFILRAWC